MKKKRELVKLWTFLPWLTTVKLKENKKKDKYLDLARELKKKQTWEYESDVYTNCNWCF